MKQILSLSRNRLISVDEDDESRSNAEIVLALAEPEYRMSNAFECRKEMGVDTVRFVANTGGIQAMIDFLESVKEELEEIDEDIGDHEGFVLRE